LTTDQIVALTTLQVKGLTTATVQALSTEQIAAIETADIQALTTSAIKALTSQQTGALSTTQIEAWTSSQISAFGTAAYSHLTTGTPIILDLNGDGVKTLSINSGVKFDLFADGTKVNTGWVSSGDGLLVLDRNHDGLINDGSELFGSSTLLANGQKAPDGYAALREMDTNHDGVINSADAVYADLRVWVDSNSDGITETGETKTLASLGIASINLNATAGAATDNGNVLGLTSSYQTTDGATHAAADVWFVADKGSSTPSAASVDSAIAALGNTSAAAVVAVDSANPLSVVGTAAPLQDIQPTMPAAVSDDLRSRVSNLAQAMGAFASTEAVDSTQTTPGLLTTGAVAAASTAASLTVGSMVDVMKQFDANGNLVAKPDAAAASLGKTLTLPGIQDPANNGFLAAGGA